MSSEEKLIVPNNTIDVKVYNSLHFNDKNELVYYRTHYVLPEPHGVTMVVGPRDHKYIIFEDNTNIIHEKIKNEYIMPIVYIKKINKDLINLCNDLYLKCYNAKHMYSTINIAKTQLNELLKIKLDTNDLVYTPLLEQIILDETNNINKITRIYNDAVSKIRENSEFIIDNTESIDNDTEEYFEIFNEAHNLYKKKFFNEGIELYKSIIVDHAFNECVYYNIACGYSMLGKLDDAFEYLDLATKNKFINWHTFEKDNELNNLRQDPRFKKYDEIKENFKLEHPEMFLI